MVILNGFNGVYSVWRFNGIYWGLILVGGAITILKNMKVNGNDSPIYCGTCNSCLKPPSSNGISWYSVS